MDTYERIALDFQETIEAITGSVDLLAEPLEQASNRIVASLLDEGKVMCCGTGASAAIGLPDLALFSVPVVPAMGTARRVSLALILLGASLWVLRPRPGAARRDRAGYPADHLASLLPRDRREFEGHGDDPGQRRGDRPLR